MKRVLSGVLAIAHTPLTEDDRIDEAALRRSIDWAFDIGVDGIGTGMVSETLKLTRDERLALPTSLVEFAAGRGPVTASRPDFVFETACPPWDGLRAALIKTDK